MEGPGLQPIIILLCPGIIIKPIYVDSSVPPHAGHARISCKKVFLYSIFIFGYIKNLGRLYFA
jgi:hypothetical protein